MLGVVLLFVGITLISNGYCGLAGVDGKSAAFINFFTGSVTFIVNTTFLLRGDYFSAGTGFLFACTNLLMGVIYLFDLDWRAYGIFGLFVAVNAIPCSYLAYASGDWRFAIIWILWGILWFSGFLQNVLALPIGKFVFYLAIFEGIVTAWIPGFLMIAELW
ncbi:AmiS/UreI family transporter [Enterococcus caccae]|uniref:Acid-activated urea channel n=1 Tax=Enterococcus caccae ATCC BAA-1240 TaxID=1158612 RepID=R3WT88_9ENTE|nr:AmiS/UreI family transporter [Enterococcus caccae]EOL50632.1 hypothetical protein UC7_00083 [Enterococcus caccae ATCC BAA-1240]EOT59475.1 hypothetical protein I580_02507 [Enterococcus caccae ATCC BAA-1240]OJG27616.1 hypothetical protein RU98_GL002319 [Enterococcus caccae]